MQKTVINSYSARRSSLQQKVYKGLGFTEKIKGKRLRPLLDMLDSNLHIIIAIDDQAIRPPSTPAQHTIEQTPYRQRVIILQGRRQ